MSTVKLTLSILKEIGVSSSARHSIKKKELTIDTIRTYNRSEKKAIFDKREDRKIFDKWLEENDDKKKSSKKKDKDKNKDKDRGKSSKREKEKGKDEKTKSKTERSARSSKKVEKDRVEKDGKKREKDKKKDRDSKEKSKRPTDERRSSKRRVEKKRDNKDKSGESNDKHRKKRRDKDITMSNEEAAELIRQIRKDEGLLMVSKYHLGKEYMDCFQPKDIIKNVAEIRGVKQREASKMCQKLLEYGYISGFKGESEFSTRVRTLYTFKNPGEVIEVISSRPEDVKEPGVGKISDRDSINSLSKLTSSTRKSVVDEKVAAIKEKDKIEELKRQIEEERLKREKLELLIQKEKMEKENAARESQLKLSSQRLSKTSDETKSAREANPPEVKTSIKAAVAKKEKESEPSEYSEYDYNSYESEYYSEYETEYDSVSESASEEKTKPDKAQTAAAKKPAVETKPAAETKAAAATSTPYKQTNSKESLSSSESTQTSNRPPLKTVMSDSKSSSYVSSIVNKYESQKDQTERCVNCFNEKPMRELADVRGDSVCKQCFDEYVDQLSSSSSEIEQEDKKSLILQRIKNQGAVGFGFENIKSNDVRSDFKFQSKNKYSNRQYNDF